MADLTIGIDLGGTKIEAALIDTDGNQTEKVRERTRVDDGADGVQRQIRNMVDQLMSKSQDSSPGGVGIALAGQIQYETGTVRGAPNLGWHDYPLGEKLSSDLDMPVVIDNDVRMAAVGEWKHGAGRDVDDLVCIFVGTGVGGGVVSGGRLLRGHANTAGEIGHMPIDLHGPACHCPNHGCLEAYAGGWAIERRARHLIEQNEKAGAAILDRVDGDKDKLSAKAVVEAAQAGDWSAQQILQVATEALVAGCTAIVNALGPRRLILGGGIIEGYQELIEQIDRGVRQRALAAALIDFEVVKAELGSMAGVIGAARAIRDLNSRKDDKDD